LGDSVLLRQLLAGRYKKRDLVQETDLEEADDLYRKLSMDPIAINLAEPPQEQARQVERIIFNQDMVGHRCLNILEPFRCPLDIWRFHKVRHRESKHSVKS